MVGPHEQSQSIKSCNCNDGLLSRRRHSTEQDLIVNDETQPEEAAELEFSSATVADAVASDVSANDDAEFNIVGIVPFVDFDSANDSNSPMANPLAIASVDESESAIESIEPEPVDWDHQDDALFSVVGTEDHQLHSPQLATELLAASNQRTLHTFGESVLQRDSDDQSNVETSAAQETEDVAKAYSRADASSLVGTAPMIVTIEEVSMPYDLEARDLKVSSLFPLSKRAFCVRDREQLLGLANEALAYGESLIELLEANSQNGKVELDMRDEHAPNYPFGCQRERDRHRSKGRNA